MRIMQMIRVGRAGVLSIGPATMLAYAGMVGNPASGAHSTFHAVADSMQTLTFVWPAINLAVQPPYDTVQLQVVVRTAAGTVVPIATTVHYTTPDTAAITVSATGLVTAHQSIALAHVIARMTQGGRTVTDTARIQVTQTPLPDPLLALSIQPQSGGLTAARGNVATIADPTPRTIPFFATVAKPHADPRAAAARICSALGCQYPLIVHYTSSDSNIAYVDDSAGFHPRRPGRVTFYISTVAYGVRKRDSLPFSVGGNDRTQTEIYLDSARQPAALATKPVKYLFSPPPYSVGLRVWIQNSTGDTIEVRLPTPAHGVHFVDGMSRTALPGSRDTITTVNATVRFDSVGTHILQYRSLNNGAMTADTFTVVPYP